MPVRFCEKNRILRNRQRQGPEFCKLQEAIWQTVINKIFKFSQHLDPFGHVNYLFELWSDYLNYPIQK